MTRKILSLVLLAALAMTMVFSAFAEAPAEVAAGDIVDGGTITISDYFDPPPAINGNVLTPSGGPGSVEYQYDRLVEFAAVPVETYANFLAADWYQDENDRTVVVLKEGLKWSDGTDLTAKDVWCTYMMRFMVADSVWQYLENVEIIDDLTLAFTWHSYSDVLPKMLFNLKIDMGYAQYGKWADQVAPYVADRTWDEEQNIFSNSEATEDARLALREDCYTWLPDITTMPSSGPYYVTSVNANEIMMTKNPNYWNAENVHVENVRIQRYVSAEAYLTTVMQGGYDTEPHGLTPDLFAQLEQQNPDMVTMWVPDMGQPAFEFNTQVYPTNITEFRQAVAYINDPAYMLEIAEPGTMPGDDYCTGLTPLWRDAYITDELKAELTNYNLPQEEAYAAADEVLTSIGWTRGDDGYWKNENGETVEVEVAAMNSWPIFFACGEALSLLLDEYGIKASFNAMELSTYWEYINNGEHQIACDFRGGSQQRGPWEAYSDQILWSNSRVGLNPEGSASNMVIEVTMKDGTVINVRNQLDAIFSGTEEEQVESIHTLMKMCNEQIFILPIGEKYAPMKIHNPELVGYPTDGNHWAWYMGHMRAYHKLLSMGYLGLTEAGVAASK
jgi:peptide/nickel transport system substrate-binding protein